MAKKSAEPAEPATPESTLFETHYILKVNLVVSKTPNEDIERYEKARKNFENELAKAERMGLSEPPVPPEPKPKRFVTEAWLNLGSKELQYAIEDFDVDLKKDITVAYLTDITLGISERYLIDIPVKEFLGHFEKLGAVIHGN